MKALFFLLLVFAVSLHAEEQTTTYRIIGLSAPDRKDDFPRDMKEIPEVELVAYDFEKNTATLRFDPAKIIPPGNKKKLADYSPAGVLLKLNELLRKASKHTFSLAEPSGTPEDKLTKIDIKVGFLDCKGCRYCVYIAVAKIDGVERATVSSETGLLTAWIDPAKTNVAALEEALIKDQIPLPGNPRSPPAGK